MQVCHLSHQTTMFHSPADVHKKCFSVCEKVRENATVTPLSWIAMYKNISKIYSQMTTTFPNGVTWVKIFNTDTKGTETTINKFCYRGVYTLEVHIFWSWYQVFHQKKASNEGVLITKKISVRRGATVGEVCMMLFLWVFLHVPESFVFLVTWD